MKSMFTALLLACLWGVSPAAAQDDLRRELRAAIGDGTNERPGLLSLLRKQEAKSVSFSSFLWSGNKSLVKTGGGIANTLSNLLADNGITTVPAADCVISGELTQIERNNANGAANLKILLMVHHKGTLVGPVTRFLYGPDICGIEGTNVVVPPGTNQEQMTELVNVARAKKTNPPVPPTPTTILLSGDGKIGLELLVAKAFEKEEALKPTLNDFKPRTLTALGGVTMVPGEAYYIKIINNNDFTLAADLFIDGMAWSQFAKMAPKVAKPGDQESETFYVVVKPKSHAIVRGWLKNMNESMAFDVVNLPAQSVSTKRKEGVISVKYHACWEKDKNPPDDEKFVNAQLSGVKTGQGQEQADKFVVIERTIGAYRGTLSLDYDRADQP